MLHLIIPPAKIYYEAPSFQLPDIISYDNIIDALIGKGDVLSKIASLTEYNERKIFLLEKVLEHYTRAKEVVEIHNRKLDTESDRLQYTDSKSSLNELELLISLKLFRLTGQQKYLEKAFMAADHAKAVQLSFGLKDEEYKKISCVPDSIIAKEKDLQEEIIFLQSSIREEQTREHPGEKNLFKMRSRLTQYFDESEKLSKYTDEKYPEYSRLKYSENNINIDTLKKIVSPDKTILEYAFARDSLFTFILTGNKFKVLSQPSKAIRDTVISFRNLLSEVTDSSFLPSGKVRYAAKAFWLYQKLIKPLESYFKSDEIIIIPDDVLNLLPFETLVTEGNLTTYTDYSLFPYLLYKYSFSYSYSAGLLFLQQKFHTFSTNKVLAYAPSYNNLNFHSSDTVSFSFLNSKEEVKNIVGIFGGRAVVGRKATKKYFIKHISERKILHLSLHAMVDNEYPVNSKLAFSQEGDSGYNGFLNNYEIYNLKLNSPLVVLNACNTGSGKLMRGEGVLSISRGFMYAGCPSMVITLWNVSDYSSIELMQYFYKNLKTKLNIDKALRQAKIQYLKHSDNMFSHPYYWAGFIQTGKTDTFLLTAHNNYFLVVLIGVICLISAFAFLRFKKKKNHPLRQVK